MKSLVDRALALMHELDGQPLNTLAVVDENTDQEELVSLTQLPNIQVLTNRYDIFLQCRALELGVTFSDVDFADVDTSFDLCLYRISKERALTHRVFNQIARYMADSGRFMIEGRKAEGIKTYHKALATQLGFAGELKKNKDIYSACLARLSTVSATKKILALDDKQYAQLRDVSAEGMVFVSKPGLYGWNKVDQGSALLIDYLTATFARGGMLHPVGAALDLGCGYGYLSIKLQELRRKGYLEQLEDMTATDNNAGAILAARANLCSSGAQLDSVSVNVVADDCGASLNKKYDLIVCNPPFHKGFDSRRELSEKFLASTARLLTENGSAFMVVNSFIPIAKLAAGYFHDIQEVQSGLQFKVFSLRKAAAGARC